MPALRSVHHLRRAALTAALLIGAALTPALLAPAAQGAAGSYAVQACAFSDELRTDAWVRSSSTGQPIDFIDRCDDPSPASVGNLDITGAFGFNAAPNSGALSAAPGRIAGFTLTAPTDATISGIFAHYAMQLATADWEFRIRAAGTVIASCAGPTTSVKCADGLTDRRDLPIPVPAGTKSLDIGIYCVAAVQCAYNAGLNPTFSLVIADASVVITDTTPPTVSSPTASGQVMGSLTGTGLIAAGGSDVGGISLVEVLDGTTVVGTREGNCVDWSLRPCSEPSASAGTSFEATFTVGELGLTSGTHTLRTRVTDAAGNPSLSDPITVIVNETVGPATNVVGGGRSRSAVREVGWLAPPGMAVAQAKIELCTIPTSPTATSKCVLEKSAPDGPANFMSEAYPNVSVRVRLTSAGGAVTYSEPVDFMYDVTPPKQPKVRLVDSPGDLRVVELEPDPSDGDLATYTALVCPAPSNRCAPLATGPMPNAGGDKIRVSTRLTSLANVRLDIAVTDTAGNTSLPGQLTLTPTAKDLGIKQSASPIAIVPKLPGKLPRSSIVVKGSTQPGAAAKVLVTVSGRNRKKKAVKTQAMAKIAAKTGSFAVRVKLPKKLDRRKGVLVTITAAPNSGWLAATTRMRVKP